MDHLQSFRSRDVLALPVAERDGWRLKRYAILAEGRRFDEDIVAAATAAAFDRLPAPGPLQDAAGNHGIGFQIIHFAETAVVSPVFYWQWGSVLARGDQIRAPWSAPTSFGTGQAEVIGCVWEMDIVNVEIDIWRRTLLTGADDPVAQLDAYLGTIAA